MPLDFVELANRSRLTRLDAELGMLESGDAMSLDFETRSIIDLRRQGAYIYAAHPTTDILCACYAFDDGPVSLWLPGDPVPESIRDHVAKKRIIKAWNAQFERLIWRYVWSIKYGVPMPDLEQFHCTAAQAAAMALPRDLDDAARVMNVDQRKDKQGHNIMLQVSKPRKYEDDGTPIWWNDPHKLEKLYAYCAQDVNTERSIGAKLKPLSASERRVYILDQQINDRGIFLDMPFVHRAIDIVDATTKNLNKKLSAATSGVVEKATQAQQIVKWLQAQGVDADSVNKAAIAELLEEDLPPDCREVLEARKDAAKSSTKKLVAMVKTVGSDGRVRGTMLYCGANTGRWAGKLIQVQNFTRGNKTTQVALVIADVMDGHDEDWLSFAHGFWAEDDVFGEPVFVPAKPLSIISDCLRGCLCAEDGNDLIASDYSNIEGRGTAWLAGETWKLEAFLAYDTLKRDDRGVILRNHKGAPLREGPDLYEVAASRIYGVEIDNVDSDKRQVGKVSELACGYQGGVGAFQTFARLYGIKIPDAEAEIIKEAWRKAHPMTKKLWYDLDEACYNAVRYRTETEIPNGKIKFIPRGGFLYMRLPSGRHLCYPRPKIEDVTTKWGSIKSSVTVESVNPYTKQWGRRALYGGLLTENAVQALARDILVAGMFNVHHAGYGIIMHAHDEIVSEVSEGFGDLDEYSNLMCQLPAWANGLPVAAAGWRGKRYRKG